IPVNVVVEGDTEGRIRNAFSEVFTKAGFRTGNNRSRYVMNVKITVSPVEMKSPNKFSRYVVDASLVDTADNTVLIPYSINGREGHATQPEADVRAIRAAENTIKSDFAEKLAGYLSSATS
ncbi:MAG: hypothetical protein LBS97_06345, partial [Treponema sp.]|nr:hypothetical protein [Treponema sp.]